ncbi:MAG: GTPase [Planctomycetota bacterium]
MGSAHFFFFMKTTSNFPFLVQGTPKGLGGISVLYLIASEEILFSWAQFCFYPFSDFSRFSRFHLSFFGSLTEPIDQILWTVLSPEESIFQSTTLEINFHGGPQILQSAKQYLTQKGAEELSMNGALIKTLGPLEGIAYQYMLSSTSSLACDCFLQQAQGALRRRLQKILQDIEEKAFLRAITALDALIETTPFGIALHTPQSFLLCGSTNVGKSFLFNRLLGEERSIVSPQEGTTIDLVRAQRLLNGFPILLMDSAGFSENPSALEKLGLEKTQKTILESLPIWVFDATHFKPEKMQQPFSSRGIYVANKADLPHPDLPPEILLVSALSGEGVSSLEKQMAQFLPSIYPAEQGILFSLEHARLLTQANRDLKQNQIQRTEDQIKLLLSKENVDLRSFK